MKKLFKYFICLTIIFMLCGCGKESNKIVMVTESGFAPYEYRSGDEVVGVDVDIAREIAKELNVDEVYSDVLPEDKQKIIASLKEKRNVNGKSAFLLEADLFTGRTHQIRVHLSEAGLPIVGDELYGGIPEKRIMLHAEKLEFNHPVSGDKLMIIAQKYF